MLRSFGARFEIVFTFCFAVISGLTAGSRSSRVHGNTVCFSVLIVLLSQSPAVACNVPVFRYALERWQPDACEVIVFHDSALTEPHAAFVRQLETVSSENGGTANVRVHRQVVDTVMEDSVSRLWEHLNADKKVSLPYMAVRSTVGKDALVTNWHGTIDEAVRANLIQSPVRSELSRRLYRGDSAVWLVLKSDDATRSDKTLRLIRDELKRLSREVPLPDGIGLPGSELLSEIPLLMKFSVLEVDPQDPQEQFLISLLHGLVPEAKTDGEPLVVPVFGRGRALEVIPASQVNAGLIEDLTLFLCGACSCQVKDMNPGFDLLLNANWKKNLYGEGPDEAVSGTAVENQLTLPILVNIPPGNDRSGGLDRAGSVAAPEAPETPASDSATDISVPGQDNESLFWSIILLIVAVLAIVLTHSFRQPFEKSHL